MRPDYLDAFAQLMDPGANAAQASTQTNPQTNTQTNTHQHRGLQWLRHSGAWFTAARTAAAPTVTAAGHASLCTGTAPVIHGIATNDFFDPQSARVVAVAQDPSATIIRTPGLLGAGPLENAPEIGSSAARLQVGALGDRLASMEPQSRSLAVSIKDRAALICGGKNPAGAYYFDKRSGSMVTSSSTGKSALPPWVDGFNRSHRPEDSDAWNLKLADRSKYVDVIGASVLAATTEAIAGRTLAFAFGQFPRFLGPGPGAAKSKLTTYERFVLTPGASDLLVDFALEGIKNEGLGQRGTLDSLVISFSTTDLVGHQFGNSSLEFVDIYLHLNESIERLRQGVNAALGPQAKVIWALAADHGIAPIPEANPNRGLGAKRIDGKAFRAELESRLGVASTQLGSKGAAGPNVITTILNDQIFLDHGSVRQLGHDPLTFAKRVADTVALMPGVVAAFTRQDIAVAAGAAKQSGAPSTGLDDLRGNPARIKDYALALFARGFQKEQTGDVVFVLKEGSLLSFGDPLANHGSIWDGDARIAMALVAPGLDPGQTVERSVYADDLLPTLLELAVPSTTGASNQSGFSGASLLPWLKFTRAHN
jgi:hypothetical protein